MSSLLLFSMDFKQQPGESDIAFIKRITMTNNNATPAKQVNKLSLALDESATNATHTDNSNHTRGVYQRIEEWDEERKAKGELTWEETVQFDGQRFGNRVRQNHILRHHIGTFF
jgi:hypothetical protein